MEQQKERQIKKVLSPAIWQQVEESGLPLGQLGEVRMRRDQPLELFVKGEYHLLEHSRVTGQALEETFEYMSRSSLYAVLDTLRQGFLTVEGGHRVGVCGHVVQKGGEISSLRDITSLNLRVSRQVKGVAHPLMPWVQGAFGIKSTLIVAPPCTGKTTLLRDVARYLSDGWEASTGVRVGMVDERSELAACGAHGPGYDVGCRTDVLDNCPKAEGIRMLVRTMAPTVVVTDELGGQGDIQAVAWGMLSGVKFLASAHGATLEDVKKNRLLAPLLEQGLFEQAVVLERDFIKTGGFAVVSLEER